MIETDNSDESRILGLPKSLDDIDISLESLNPNKLISFAIDLSEFQKIGKVPLLESSLIQWAATLWNTARENSISVQNSAHENHYSRLASSPASAVLALLPPGKLSQIDRRTAAIFKKQFFEQQKKWPDLAVGSSAFILCLDSYSAGGLPHQLYSNNLSGNVTNWDGFRLFLSKLMSSVAEESQIQGEIQKRSNHLSTILFELFKNTHDHARLGVDGAVINDSTRGIYARFYPTNEISEKLLEPSESFNALDNYFRVMLKPMLQNNKAAPTNRNLSGFLELTVFDNGPGMAAKWLESNLSNHSGQEQYDAVVQCLKKGNSSTNTGTRGFGLWRVLQELIQVKGFIRIRTNGVHVFRQYAMLENLHMEHHADGHKTPQERFTDWKKQFTSTLSNYPHTRGTTISIVVPLGEL